jgi:hypothetical protein
VAEEFNTAEIERRLRILYTSGATLVCGGSRAWEDGDEIVKHAAKLGLAAHVEKLDDVGVLVVLDTPRKRIPFWLWSPYAKMRFKDWHWRRRLRRTPPVSPTAEELYARLLKGHRDSDGRIHGMLCCGDDLVMEVFRLAEADGWAVQWLGGNFGECALVPPVTSSWAISVPRRFSPSNYEDRLLAYNFVRGAVTGLLSVRGWEIEAYRETWIHWFKGNKKIVMRGVGLLGSDHFEIWADTTSFADMKTLAAELSAALGETVEVMRD